MNVIVHRALRVAKSEAVGYVKFAWLTVRSINPIAVTLVGMFYVAVFFVSTDPAAAATPEPEEGPTTIASFMGCATFDWAASLVPAARELTGIISSVGYLLIAVIALAIGIAYLMAGRRADKAADVQQAVKNASTGALLIVFGVPLLILILGGVTFFCTLFIGA